MITITEAAAQRIQSILKHWETKGVRLEVKGGGCSGFMYEFSSVDELEDGDTIIDGLVIDSLSAPLLDEATLDLKKDLMEEKFVVINPKATRQYGCGQSFSS